MIDPRCESCVAACRAIISSPLIVTDKRVSLCVVKIRNADVCSVNCCVNRENLVTSVYTNHLAYYHLVSIVNSGLNDMHCRINFGALTTQASHFYNTQTQLDCL